MDPQGQEERRGGRNWFPRLENRFVGAMFFSVGGLDSVVLAD